LVAGVLCIFSAAALAATITGTTSQQGSVRLTLLAHQRVVGLIIQLRTHCTDHISRDIWPGFQAPFRHPQDAGGNLGDAYDIVGRDVTTGVRFRQRASFAARVSRRTVTGTATVTQTFIAAGVVCTSPRVRFSVNL
jgi:hypothetical protein